MRLVELASIVLAFRKLISFVISSASLEFIFIAETSILTAGAFPTQHLTDAVREYQI